MPRMRGTSSRSSRMSSPGGWPRSIASMSNSCSAPSINGSRFIPQVPPSISRTGSGNRQPSRRRSSAAMPRPSSAMIGLPRPTTSVSAEVFSFIDEFLLARHEPASADDGGDGPSPLQHVGSGGQVDVDRNEGEKTPGGHMVNEANHRHSAEQRGDPTENSE